MYLVSELKQGGGEDFNGLVNHLDETVKKFWSNNRFACDRSRDKNYNFHVARARFQKKKNLFSKREVKGFLVSKRKKLAFSQVNY